MKKFVLVCASVLLIYTPSFAYQSLQEVFDNAGPGQGYDIYIELDPEIEYLGDLYIYDGEVVRIVGNGARIHVTPTRQGIVVDFSTLDISGCVFIGGLFNLYYGYNSQGRIFNNTFYSPDSLASIGVDYTDWFTDIEIYNNIISGAPYGILATEDNIPEFIDYNIVYNSDFEHYAYICPG
ncbi:MAG: hypothetical protein GF307_02930 [candidate division Zixibacteria bacterium]|nr:hypothetical protein [candidate division Zixibacteria bacterium]